MIYINFVIKNPFWKPSHTPIWDINFPLTKNKFIEFGFYNVSALVEFSFMVTEFKRDHAGFSIDISLAGYSAEFIFYDVRHHDERAN